MTRANQLSDNSSATPTKVTTDICRAVIADYFMKTPTAIDDSDAQVHALILKDATNPRKCKRIERYKPDEYNVPVDESHGVKQVLVFTPGVTSNFIEGDAGIPFDQVKWARQFALDSDHADLNVFTVEHMSGQVHVSEINFD